jgi:hypothetical protein
MAAPVQRTTQPIPATIRLPMKVCVRNPSLGSILIGLIPFGAVCFGVPLWDRVDPMLFGLPFNLFWLVLWTLLTPLMPLIMWFAYLRDSKLESSAVSFVAPFAPPSAKSLAPPLASAVAFLMFTKRDPFLGINVGFFCALPQLRQSASPPALR